jgi:protein ImuB
LCSDLLAVPREPAAEHAALQALAAWAYQYSAQVVPLAPPTRRDSGLLIETGASTRLFGGRAALHRRIARSLRTLGHHAAFGCAATPRAAWLLASAAAQGAHPGPAALAPEELAARVEVLPLSLFDWDEPLLDTLRTLGLARAQDLLALPRAPFVKRFGRAPLDDLDRALGRLPDPQPAFEPPARFAARLELPADLTEAQQLLFPAHRLLRLAAGFLRGRDRAACSFDFAAHHSPRRARPTPPTRFALQLAAPERDAARLARLLGERLARLALPEPAIALELAIDALQPYAPPLPSLLPGADSSGSDWLQLAETLHARLGSERVFQIEPADEHRPELAWRCVPVSPAPRSAPAQAAAAIQRPLLLLSRAHPLACDAQDAPLHAGPLDLLAGPERIEAGWWDSQGPAVHRDYFVARNPRGQTLWVYRELAAPHGWYLHGYFA